MPASFIYKPNTYKGPVLLVPDNLPKSPPTITLPDGTTVQGKYLNTNEGRHQFVLPDQMIGMSGIKVDYNGMSSTIGNGAMSYEGSGLDNWQERFKGSMADPSGTGTSGMGGMGGMGMGGMPNPFMMNFNPVSFKPIKFKNIDYTPINYTPINYKPMEAADYKFVDPIQSASRYNEFNRAQESSAYGTGMQRGKQLSDIDTAYTMDFAGKMSGLQQSLVDSENKFNQAQRLKAVDFAMPDLRATLDQKRDRANTFASGRLLSSAEDRAYEVAARSASADGSFTRGFGDDSTFGRRTSDMLSAQQRLGITQMGEGMLNDWISQGSQLLIDTPLKTSISQRLPSTPGILPSQLGAQQQNALTNLTTVPLQFGISSEINQQQYETNLEQNTRQFNTSNELITDQFNAGNTFSKDQFNAANTFSKDQFNAGNTLAKDQFNASNTLGAAQFNSSGAFQASQAQFSGLQTNYQLATQASNRADDIARQDAHNQAASVAANQNIGAQQSAGAAGSTGQIIGGIVGAASTLGPIIAGMIAGPTTTADGGATVGGGSVPGASGGGAAVGGGASGGSATGGQSTDAIFGIDGGSYNPDLGGGYTPSYDFGGDSSGGGGGDFGISGGSSGGDMSLTPDGGFMQYARSAPGGGGSGGGGGGVQSRSLKLASGGPTEYNGSAIPVSRGGYDESASAQSVSQGMAASGDFISQMGQSGPSVPQFTTLGTSLKTGASAGQAIIDSFQAASTPEAQKQLAGQLQGAARANASTPESQATVDQIFSQVNEHIDNGVEVTGQAAGIAGFIKNYDKYNGPERVRAITNISFAGQDMEGNFGVKDLTAASLNRLSVPGTNNKMTMQDALSLANSGYNVTSLVRNWDDVEEVHGTLNGKGNVLSIASTARNLGLIDDDTPETVKAKQAVLTTAGAEPAGAWGAGAVSLPSDNAGMISSIGYVPIGKTADGKTVALPKESAASAGLSTGVIGSGADPESLKFMGPQTLAVGQRAAEVYNNWRQDFIPKSQGQMGAKPAVANGLYKLGQKDPYLVGNVILTGMEKGQVSKETQQFYSKEARAARAAPQGAQPVVQRNFTTQQSREIIQQAQARPRTGPTTAQQVQLGTTAAQAIINTAAAAGSKDAKTAQSYAGAVMAGQNLYNVFTNPNATDEQKAQAIVGAAQSGVQIAARNGSSSAAGAAPYIAYAMAAYQGVKVLTGDGTDEQKAVAMRRMGEDMVAAYFTLGISSVVQWADQQFLGGTLNKIRGKIEGIDPVIGVTDKITSKVIGAFGGGFGGGKNKDQQGRDHYREIGQRLGLIDQDWNMTLASGQKFDVGVDGKGGKREWFDPNLRRPDQTDVETLHAYDIDYTRDLDAVMNVGGVALSTLLYGNADDENARKMGNYFTNASVSDANTPALSREGFSTAQANLQGFFKQAGVETKAEAYALSNQMLQEGRLSQTQVVSVQQGINLAFDQNAFQGANSLLEGVKLGRKGDDIKKPTESQGTGEASGSTSATPDTTQGIPENPNNDAIAAISPHFKWQKGPEPITKVSGKVGQSKAFRAEQRDRPERESRVIKPRSALTDESLAMDTPNG